MDRIRWGFLGAGSIARRFGLGMQEVAEAELLAVGSRTAERAQALVDDYQIPRQYDTYEELVQDPDVDVVYVATPHNFHRDHSILALEAGKAVLCEKPFAINVREAAEIVAVARQRDLFLMEAMWVRYHPLLREVRRMVQDGTIGDLTLMVSDFGFRGAVPMQGRIADPTLGGGGLLDLGIYPVSLASFLWGMAPTRIEAMAHLADGVDQRGAILLGYPAGQMAICYCSIRDNSPQETLLMGSQGEIRIPHPWWLNNHCFLTQEGQAPRRIETPLITNGFAHEIIEVNRCLREGLRESPDMTWDETLTIMTTLDTIRAQWGLRFPME